MRDDKVKIMEAQTQYYKQRAKEYELVYQKPERQKDLKQIKAYLTKHFRPQNLIEIACGTGYWTAMLAKNTDQILGIDINGEVIELAKQKDYHSSNVRFEVIDFKALEQSEQKFDGLFGGFIWSHLLQQEIDHFVSMMLKLVQSKGQLIFVDNKFVEGNSTPISRKDEAGNTFQNRRLTNGQQFEIIKNYPSREAMLALWEKAALNIKWVDFEYYWLIDIKRK